jgi:hypothetical protein
MLAGLATVLFLAACGDDGSSEASDSGDTTADETSSSEIEPGAFAAENYTTDLADVCPDPLRVQLGWLAEPEHHVFFQLIGGGGTMEQNKYSGPLGSTGIDLEILDGGPGLGDGVTVASSLYAGNLVQGVTPDIAFIADGDIVAASGEFPIISVLQAFEKDPQNLVFDPETYDLTDLDSVIAAVEEEGAQIYVTSKQLAYVQFLIGSGVPEDAFIEGFAGDYERFITAGGSLINQGYSTDTNPRLEDEIPEWGKPTGGVYLADLGWDTYSQNVVVAESRLEELRPCLEGLVPIMQQSIVDYIADPTEVNEMLASYNEQGFGAPFWTTSMVHNEAAYDVMVEDGLVANGGDDTIGNAEGDRIQNTIDIVVPILLEQGVEVNGDITPEDMFTDEFLDPSIGLP